MWRQLLSAVLVFSTSSVQATQDPDLQLQPRGIIQRLGDLQTKISDLIELGTAAASVQVLTQPEKFFQHAALSSSKISETCAKQINYFLDSLVLGNKWTVKCRYLFLISRLFRFRCGGANG